MFLLLNLDPLAMPILRVDVTLMPNFSHPIAQHVDYSYMLVCCTLLRSVSFLSCNYFELLEFLQQIVIKMYVVS